MMFPKLLENGVLQLSYENYQPWPNFRPLGSSLLGGLWRAHFLREILCSDDLSCAVWRAPIPPEILRFLRQFPECHCELIAMAQTMPDHLVRQSKLNPALTLIAAAYWQFRKLGKVPSIEERTTLWENLDADQLLSYCRLPDTNSFLRTLAKIQIEHAYLYRIDSLRNHWQVPKKRKLLQHLPVITGENLWLLSCFPPILDPAIHQLAAREPEHEEFSILEVISDLSNRRELAGMDSWPYRNRIHSWPQLLAAYNRFLRKTHCVVEVFPPPPIGEFEDEEMHIVPLKSRTALGQEGKAMLNCIECYSAECSYLKHYAYRLLRPERATVLIKRQYRHWIIEEAMIRANERQVRSATMKLLCRWVRTTPDN
jgi:hypothetical protein